MHADLRRSRNKFVVRLQETVKASEAPSFFGLIYLSIVTLLIILGHAAWILLSTVLGVIRLLCIASFTLVDGVVIMGWFWWSMASKKKETK